MLFCVFVMICCSLSVSFCVSATSVSLLLSFLVARFSVLTSSVMPMYLAASLVASFCETVVFPVPGVPVTRITVLISGPFLCAYSMVVFFVLEALWYIFSVCSKGFKES